MPRHIFTFASDPRHHDLTSPDSLHDAWLEHLDIAEDRSADPREVRVAICLLGPQHDRRIYLTYHRVRSYKMRAPVKSGHSMFAQHGHGDVLVHELVMLREVCFHLNCCFPAVLYSQLNFQTSTIVSISQ
jgi:hypothetical protein